MRGTILARTLLGLAVLMLVGATALAQDNNSIITINGGTTAVMMKAPSLVVNHKNKPPCLAAGFYDNYQPAGCSYRTGIGWEASDGLVGFPEATPGNKIVSLKSGITMAIRVGVSLGVGSNDAIVILDNDCGGIPCGIIDKTNICKGTIQGLPKFGKSNVVMESFRCVAQLVKGKAYWVYIQSLANSQVVWNFSQGAVGGFVYGNNDVWQPPVSGQPVGALQIF